MSEKYSFIDVESAACPEGRTVLCPVDVQMCEWMGVSNSGFYGWRKRPEASDAKGAGYSFKSGSIRGPMTRTDTGGSTRRWSWGGEAGRDLSGRSCVSWAWSPASRSPGGSPHRAGRPGARHPHLVNRDFTADTPGQKMVGDITYISTWESWLFLATIMDCHAKAHEIG